MKLRFFLLLVVMSSNVFGQNPTIAKLHTYNDSIAYIQYPSSDSTYFNFICGKYILKSGKFFFKKEKIRKITLEDVVIFHDSILTHGKFKIISKVKHFRSETFFCYPELKFQIDSNLYDNDFNDGLAEFSGCYQSLVVSSLEDEVLQATLLLDRDILYKTPPVQLSEYNNTAILNAMVICDKIDDTSLAKNNYPKSIRINDMIFPVKYRKRLPD